MDATAFGQPLEVDHIQDGFTPVDVIVVVKGLDENGDLAVYQCSTDNLSTWEALGMLTACADTLRKGLQK